MHLASLLTHVLALMPALSHALAGMNWSIKSSANLKDITFPIIMTKAPHKYGYFFAQQFSFANNEMGYTGLQPRPKNDQGESIVTAVFSSFVLGTNTRDKQCRPGVEDAPGVSCIVEFVGDYRDTYLCQVVNTRGTTWTGTVINNRTKVQTHIGTYTLPYGSGGIKKEDVGFVEYYQWDVNEHKCSSLPFTSVMFGDPMIKGGEVVGTLSRPYEYGDCKGEVGFKTSRTAAGELVELGLTD